MNIVVFGASGATGRALVAQALAKGHRVTAFVRTPAKFDIAHERLNIVQGDVIDAGAVARAIAGQDAVFSSLGAATPFKRDPALIVGVGNIVQTMDRSGPRRLIYQSYLGVREGRHQLGFLGASVVAPLLMRIPVADHEAKESIIRNSRLDWTIVRAPKLTNGPHTGLLRHGEQIKAQSIFPLISRADVADFMLRELDDSTYLRKATAVMH